MTAWAEALADYLLWPQGLPLLLLAPLLWLSLWLFERGQQRRRQRLLGVRAGRLDELHRGERLLARSAGALGLLSLGVAALQPLGGTSARDLQQRGVDLVVCLDVSRSMLARDLQPDRLGAAQREIAALCERVRGDRTALVLFAGSARLWVPLTQDHATLSELAQQASPLIGVRGGTDLGAALDCALQALQGTAAGSGAVLLLTDGEDHEQRGLQAAARCRQRGVVVHCVGLGSVLGSKIALPAGGGDGFLRDRNGSEVVSVLDVEGLRRLAAAAGGDFVDASVQPRPLVMLYEQRILPMRRQVFASQELKERDNLYQWPLLVAVLCWMLELLLCERRMR